MRGDSFSVEIENLTDFARRMGPDAVRVVGSELGDGVQESTELARDKANHLINRRTQGPGAGLTENVSITVRAGRTDIIGIAEWLKPYARFVDRGRGPVYAPKGKVLPMVINGALIFRKRAKAAPPQNFTVRGAVWATPEINRRLAARMANVVRFLEGGGR